MKVIDIRNDGQLVLLGLEDGGIREVSKDCFNYNPHIGDVVEIYESGDTIVVSKKGSSEKSFDSFIKRDEVDGKVSVNKWVYVLLAFFLGYLGIHKFYVGKNWQGVLYILFTWTCIPALISFVECIIAIFKEADADGNILV